MSSNLFHRSVSFCLAAMLTVAMLGAVDQLFQPELAAPQWAQKTTVRA